MPLLLRLRLGDPLNPWAALVLAGLLGQFGLEFAAALLNLRALRPEPPAELAGVYDAERFRRAQEYTRERTRFGLVIAAFDLLAILAFWFAGGLGALDETVRRLGLGLIATGVVFFGVLGLGWTLLHVPVRWWSTFVLEERFGFNRTTPRTFWADLVKGLALAVAVGGPLVAAILWLLEMLGPRAWLWCWLASALYAVAVQFVAPTWIMPLFNRFLPLDDGPVREAILSYARAVRFPLAGVFVIDGSRRSSKANAFFTGFGSQRRIALFDTLLAKLDPGAVVAVVAHEVGHYKCGHILRAMALSILQMGATFFLLSIVLRERGVFEAFFVETPSVHVGLVAFALLLSPVELPLSVLLNALSRRHEYQADTFAARTIGSGEPLARALGRLAADSLANPTPHPLHVLLHASHPPILERIRTLERRLT